MYIGHIKLVAQFSVALAADITTTRPRNLAWLDFCYSPLVVVVLGAIHMGMI